ELSGCDLGNTTCTFSPTAATSMNMTGKYPTIFSSAASTLEWYFNMQQNRPDPTGFAGGQYGSAFVIGSNTNDPAASSKTGYAVIFGESGLLDPVRLVCFNGSVFNSTTFTNIISVPSPAIKTNYMSIKVTFDPCTNEWTLTVRDDGLAFADPATVSGIGGTGINSTLTSTNLLWLGAVWNHASSCSLAKFDNFYIPKAAANSGSYIWNGNFGTDFQVPYNWTPQRQCTKPTDKLLFNATSPSSSVITNIPDQFIGQLTVTNNRIVTLKDKAGDGIVNTLTITGSTGTDLQVAAGSSILFDVSTAAAGDAMCINLATGATADIAGIISFNSQPGGGKAHRLLADDPLAITVSSGGVIKAMDLSGNPFGTSLPANTVVFNAGSIYECYNGANPFGLAQPASKVIFNTGSTYRHFSGNQPSLIGRTYANYESNINTNITIGGAAAFTVDDLKIISGSLQFTGVSNSLPVNTDIKGNLLLSAGTTFNYDPLVSSTLCFKSSTVVQKINNAGTLNFGRQLTVRLNSSFATIPQLSVETDIAVAGVLDIVQGTLKLTGNITLLSDSFNTASIAAVTGAISYGAGRFKVERFIPAHNKAWQFLAVPTTGQTVNQAWQEGNAPMIAGAPGFGTIITNNVAGTGFDLIGGNAPSMKTYDTTSAGSWKGITRTDSAIYNSKGYMLFVRGDRNVSTPGALPTKTILRTTGKIFEPSNLPPVISIGSGKFESIGNPYASAIDFSNDASLIKSANVQRIFYVWDPKLGGGLGFGGYQTFIKGAGTDYTVSPGGGSYGIGGSVNNVIQSGQAFFVHTVGGSGTITFTEGAKVAASSLVTRFAAANNSGELRTNLYAGVGANGILIDGVLNEFHRNYSSSFDVLDALKLDNTGESISILADAHILSVERREKIRDRDTISFMLDRLKVQEYQFEFMPVNISRPYLKAYLEDKFMETSTPVSLSSISTITFNVSTDPGSSSRDRFRIIFKQGNSQVDQDGQLISFQSRTKFLRYKVKFSSY
ncbi:MAG: hypothetical protein ABIO04_10915, partial [Ferruginibacter sp.]